MNGPNDNIPRHLRVAPVNAQRAFESDDIGALGTFNEVLQPMLDAAVAWGRRGAKMHPKERRQDPLSQALNEGDGTYKP